MISKELHRFYDEREICYFLEGEIEVTPEGGTPVKAEKGDLVTFPQGMACTWKVLADVCKHYRFYEKMKPIQ